MLCVIINILLKQAISTHYQKKKGILSPKAVSRESSSTQVRLMGKRRLTN